MSLASELREVLKLRDEVEERSQGNDYHGMQQCWKKEIALLTADMDETIRFMDTECTADEYGWISEVFEDVAEITQSRRFLEAIHRLADKYPEETEKDKLLTYIVGAEELIWDDDEESSGQNGG
jgi:hypothetical protein